MTKQQFADAVQLIRDGRDVSGADDTPLHGYGLPGFQPVTVTLEAAAKFIAWHCQQLNGQFDGEALNEMRELSRKRWLIC
jgi:hypothetical protein